MKTKFLVLLDRMVEISDYPDEIEGGPAPSTTAFGY